MLATGIAHAAEIRARVVDTEGQPVNEAVLYAMPRGDKPRLNADELVIIDQIDKTYVPHVTVIPVGTKISFPNKDDIRHHVYSFSQAKKFELPLYEGTPANPVEFGYAGTVVLGCNIHDWMKAYIYVVDTPYFAKSGKDGELLVSSLPGGEYEVYIEHPRMVEKASVLAKNVILGEDTTESLSYQIELKPEKRQRRAPKGRRKGYL